MTQEEHLDHSHHSDDPNDHHLAPPPSLTVNNNNNINNDEPNPNKSKNMQICICDDHNDNKSTSSSPPIAIVVVNGNEILAEHSPDTSVRSDTEKFPTVSVVRATDDSEANKSTNEIDDKMTVITPHQNSGENIREIIETKIVETKIVDNEKIVPSDGQSDEVSRAPVVAPPTVVDDDPIVRLNKLRASISNALSEVKGVLRQYSTDKSFDDDGSETNKPEVSATDADDGAVKFRFVRKIRRRSQVADVEDAASGKAELAKIEEKVAEEAKLSGQIPLAGKRSAESVEEKKPSAAIETKIEENKEEPRKSTPSSEKAQTKDSGVTSPPKTKKKVLRKQTSIESDDSSVASQKPVVKSKVNKKPKTDDDNNNKTSKTSKTAKPPKIAPKSGEPRRASIAAVEPSKIIADMTTSNLNLVDRRRPSDSGTIVKQPPIVAIVRSDKSLPIIDAVSVRIEQSPTAGGVHTDLSKKLAADPIATIGVQPSLAKLDPVVQPEVHPSRAKLDVTTIGAQPLNKVDPVVQPATLGSENKPAEVHPSSPKLATTKSGAQPLNKVDPVVQPATLLSEKNPAEVHPSSAKLDATTIGAQPLSKVDPVSQPATLPLEKKPTEIPGLEAHPIAEPPHQPEQILPETSTMTNGNKSELIKRNQSQESSTKIAGDVVSPDAENKENHPPKAPSNPDLALVPVPPLTEQIYVEPEVPEPLRVPKDDVAKKLGAIKKEVVLEEPTPTEVAAAAPAECKKRKTKRKVIIRRIKRKLSRDDTFNQSVEEAPPETEVSTKDIFEEPEVVEEPEVPVVRKPCLRLRAFAEGDVVMYGERYRKTQLKWKRAIVIERITSISYKLKFPNGDEKPAHISFIKKFTDRKVSFGGKEYLEIDYEQIEEDEEAERNYSIWNHV